MGLPEVRVFSLGGTISSTGSGDRGVSPTLTGEALVAEIPEIGEVADVSADSFRQVASGELTLEDMVELAGEVRACTEAGVEGVVITQGTDTIEETAFALDLLVEHDAPVVVTGAMRNPTLPGADGPANLLASVRVAASLAARGLGALVVMNDEIHAARFVRKTHTQSPATFRSDPVGPIGWVAEGRVRVALRPVGGWKIGAGRVGEIPRVALLTAALGEEGLFLEDIRRHGYAGLVVEALGGGHVPSSMVEPLSRLAAEIPVVLASRTGSGEVLRSTYGFPGSEIDLIDRGLVPAGFLDGPKARVLLSLLLAAGADRREVAGAFDSVPEALSSSPAPGSGGERR